MNVIPCQHNAELQKQIETFAEVLKTEAHKLGKHGLPEAEFYGEGGLFRGAIERTGEDFCARADRTTVRGWSRDRELSDGALCSLR